MNAALSRDDTERLTIWKWRHLLESEGFSAVEAARLAFLAWMYRTGRVNA